MIICHNTSTLGSSFPMTQPLGVSRQSRSHSALVILYAMESLDFHGFFENCFVILHGDLEHKSESGIFSEIYLNHIFIFCSQSFVPDLKTFCAQKNFRCRTINTKDRWKS